MRVRRLQVACLAALLCAGAAPSAAAQTPVPRDTITRRPSPAPTGGDTVPIPAGAVAQDTFLNRQRTANRSPADTGAVRPAPAFPEFARRPPPIAALGVTVFERPELLRYPGLTLLELIERVPGVLVTRGGAPGRRVAVSPLGAGAGRLRVFLDGWELDPLEAPEIQLEAIPFADLERVRVERRLREVRVYLTPFRQTETRPYSMVELGTGDYDTRQLSLLFSRPIGPRSGFSVSLSTSDTDGPARTLGTRETTFASQPFAATSIYGQVFFLNRPNAGLQLEVRQQAVDVADDPTDVGRTTRTVLSADRRDLLLRGRATLRGLDLEAFVGRSTREPDGSEPRPAIDLGTTTAGARAGVTRARGYAEALTRFRAGDPAGFSVPGLEVAAEAGIRPIALLSLDGSARLAPGGGTEAEASVRFGPIRGLGFFASAGAGERTLRTGLDSLVFRVDTVRRANAPDSVAADTGFLLIDFPSRFQAARLGAEFVRGGLQLAAAFVSATLDSLLLPAFLPRTRLGVGTVAGATRTGFEASGSVPLWPIRGLRLEGSYVQWSDTAGTPLLPSRYGRAALVFRNLYRTGNVEPFVRVEAVHRGPSTGVARLVRNELPVEVGAYTVLNLGVQLRIIDVRIFLLADNLLANLTAADVAGRPLGGSRVIYGVRWDFRN